MAFFTQRPLRMRHGRHAVVAFFAEPLRPLREIEIVEKIEHIGIAVKDLQTAIPLWEALLNTPCYKTESVAREGVETAFLQTGDSKIELLQSTRDDGPIGKFIAKRGEGIHHIAFAVSDIRAEMKRLLALGFELLGGEPKPGADGKEVVFLHPKSANGVLVELCADSTRE